MAASVDVTEIFDAVVVGAGPAGLSAAAELSGRGASCLLVEAGPGPRARRRDVDLLAGVGGAGLFSDGKHSFFPSATALWALPDRPRLRVAFEHTAELLRAHGVEAGGLPTAAEVPFAPLGAWHAKPYPSIYMSFDERLRCIEALWGGAPLRRAQAQVVDAGRAGAELVVALAHAGARTEVRTARLIVATGRWSLRWTRPWLEALGARFAFRRVEFGVRLEARAAASIFDALPGVDGKLRLLGPDATVEARTFCTCRDGEVLLGHAFGLRGHSGRADGPPTGRSNFGLVVRTTDETLGREVEAHLYTAAPVTLSLARWRQEGPSALAPHFGARGAALLAGTLARLLDWHPPLGAEDVQVYSPCIEGVGDYALDDGDLRIAPGVHVAGDAVGRFRGLVASLISGRYAALGGAG